MCSSDLERYKIIVFFLYIQNIYLLLDIGFATIYTYISEKKTNFNELILLPKKKKNSNELMNYSRLKADNYLSQVLHGQTYLKQKIINRPTQTQAINKCNSCHAHCEK